MEKKMMNMKLIFTLMMLLCGIVHIQAQSADNDKKVKRILFDREQVTVVYADGTQEEADNGIVVKKEGKTTSIKGIKGKKSKNSELYDLQGRKLTAAPQRKGVYIKREGKQVRKIVKK
ncbi:MAG: hypothetical protein IJP75_11985 [Bacteroidaceae bacterium]|nr:hypothetical protein [Bacteroidaceae bacterium]